jgi:hypothetical protein
MRTYYHNKAILLSVILVVIISLFYIESASADCNSCLAACRGVSGCCTGSGCMCSCECSGIGCPLTCDSCHFVDYNCPMFHTCPICSPKKPPPSFPSQISYFFDPAAVPLNPTFGWDRVADANDYTAEICGPSQATDINGNPIACSVCGNGMCSSDSPVLKTDSKNNVWQVTSGLTPNKTYWFRIRSNNCYGSGSWGYLPSSFTTSSCGYSLLPQAYAYGPQGGTGTVTVRPSNPINCGWTAKSNYPWITITSGSSGTGNGTVSYHVDANTTGTGRIGSITIGGQGLTVYQVGSTFIDDPQSGGFVPYVQAIYTEGITVGCRNGYYCPLDQVTRGQMAAFIIRAIYGESFSYTPTPYFTDVPSTHTFFKYVQMMKDTGITAVTGTYDVDGTVTRGQMAAFIIRSLYGEDFSYTTTPYFNDVPSTHGFFKYVQKMKDAGITAVTGTYDVNGTVTRGQMAAFLGRAFLGMQ